MTKRFVAAALTLMGLALAPGFASAQIQPTPFFCSFYDDNSTINGALFPPGTIITAFDQSGVLCGVDTVSVDGLYGFMPIYGDDPNTVGIDEGASNGELITVKVNDKVATVTLGTATWTNQTNKQIRLSSTQNVSIHVISLFANKAGTFNDTVRFEAVFQNDGDGYDFYDVLAEPNNSNFVMLTQTDNFGVHPGNQVTVYFDIETPVFVGGNGDTVITIDYTVTSLVDPTKQITGQVLLYFTITDVGDDDNGMLPSGFALNQNYPNPFNPTTTISFSLAQSSVATLEVFNVLGQQVSSIELGRLSAGDHEVEYDASRLTSGVYFYRLTAGDQKQLRKMVLIK